MYRIDFIVLKSAYIWKSSRAESNHKENYGALDPPPPTGQNAERNYLGGCPIIRGYRGPPQIAS